jgi:hypothetical protein
MGRGQRSLVGVYVKRGKLNLLIRFVSYLHQFEHEQRHLLPLPGRDGVVVPRHEFLCLVAHLLHHLGRDSPIVPNVPHQH